MGDLEFNYEVFKNHLDDVNLVSYLVVKSEGYKWRLDYWSQIILNYINHKELGLPLDEIELKRQVKYLFVSIVAIGMQIEREKNK